MASPVCCSPTPTTAAESAVIFRPAHIRESCEGDATGMQLTGLEGRVAIVAEAGRLCGIGHHVALEMAKAGCDIVLTGTD